MKFTILALSVFLTTTPTLIAQLKDSSKTYTIRKTTLTISVDGFIDSVWCAADSVSDFFQLKPYYSKDPSQRTVAKLLTTEESIFCLIVCYDSIQNIQANKGILDDFSGDVVSVMFDTFGDKQSAYKFAVGASGVRMDCRLLDDARNRDYNWDGVWFANSKVYDWGFVVEMEIPYRSIQYDENLTSWGLDFDRWRPINSEDLYWNRYEQNEGQRVSKWGQMRFENFRPTIKGLNLEVYPVGIAKVKYLRSGGSKVSSSANDLDLKNYKTTPDAGVDIFYNPSQSITLQLTANPDFAQIEADPFSFNISRYESYFNERRPFFTQGNEIFMASGKDRNSGFYTPLELFYPRRIGKKLPDGSEVPLLLGTKAFGRVDDWEYGGFLATTDTKDYFNKEDSTWINEPHAYFTSARVKKQILGNSSIGVLFVGKHTKFDDNGVIDIDGAFRSSDWQLAYQLARSIQNTGGDYAGSAGLRIGKDNYLVALRTRYIGNNFDVNQVGYVPWIGTWQTTGLCGPRWFFEEGYISEIVCYIGPHLFYKKSEDYTDHSIVIGMDMMFRTNWGYEINFITGYSRDEHVTYSPTELDLSMWFNVSPKWDFSYYTGYVNHTYNYGRGYVAGYGWFGGQVNWRTHTTVTLGASFEIDKEYRPDGSIQETTINARPFISLIPVNDLSIRLYIDNVYTSSDHKIQQIIGGFLFAYNFSPKSWIYLALNEVQQRNSSANLAVKERAGVLKIKYLYYF
jgi:hypothetical protein